MKKLRANIAIKVPDMGRVGKTIHIWWIKTGHWRQHQTDVSMAKMKPTITQIL